MSGEIALEGFETHLVASTEDELDAELRDESVFRVALLGDWSGRSNRGLRASGEELAQWRPRLIDRDNLDQLMTQLGVRLRLPLAKDTELSLDFNGLDDFHPDRVFERGEPFQALKDIRARLSNPKTFAAAAAEVRRRLGAPEPAPKAKLETEKPTAPVDDKTSLLDQILAQPDKPATGKQQSVVPVSSELQSFVQELVAPYLLPDQDEQEGLLDAVDKAIGDAMRNVIHHPDYQGLEAAWRGLDFLVSRLATGTELKLYLLDISRDELASALKESGDIESNGIYELLVESSVKTFGGERWALLAGNYFFGSIVEDFELLKGLSHIAASAAAPFIAGATSTLLGCDSLASTPDTDDWKDASDSEADQAWLDLRHSRDADYVGLALPRFLLRMPYGEATEPTEDFHFEELLPGERDHESYLWANAAFAIVYSLSQSFLQSGWQMRPGEVQDIEDLPIYLFNEDGESQIKPCAEILMNITTATEIIEHGLMPLITMKNTGVARVGLVQSIASPRAALSGRWNS